MADLILSPPFCGMNMQEDNCYYEFHYAHQEKPDKMVFVLVEKEVGLEHWKGYLAPYKSFLSYDMSDPFGQIDESVFRKVAEMLQPTVYVTGTRSSSPYWQCCFDVLATTFSRTQGEDIKPTPSSVLVGMAITQYYRLTMCSSLCMPSE